MIAKITLILTFLNFINIAHGHIYKSCEVEFISHLSRIQQSQKVSNQFLNIWSSDFSPAQFYKEQLMNKNLTLQIETLEELSQLILKDELFLKNYISLFNFLFTKNKLFKDIYLDLSYKVNNFYKLAYDTSLDKAYYTFNASPEKLRLVEDILSNDTLSSQLKIHYREIFLTNNITANELQLIKESLTQAQLANNFQDIKEYLGFLSLNDDAFRLKGIKEITNIFNSSYKPSKVSLYFAKSPSKQFLSLKYKVKSYEENIYVKNVFKEQELKGKLSNDDLVKIRNNSQKQASVFRNLLTRCGKTGGKTSPGAAEKFAKFKLGLMLTLNPTMYVSTNYDKKDTDPYFWEKLGHELAMGLMFTIVGNKIYTNNNTSFFTKYLDGFWKFSLLGLTETTSYDYLFGEKSMARHLKSLYGTGSFSKSEVEVEMVKMLSSEDFSTELKKLTDFLDDHKKDNNLKNFLEKHFTGTKSRDATKLTIEDLQSIEGREFLMELVAERIYLMNMGEWSIFQTGNKGYDRWLFYNSRNLLFDIKGLALNLAIFEMMCTEPFGRVGSWAAILSMVFTDYYLSGSLTYQFRREAINQ